jgi:hypothetical protein
MAQGVTLVEKRTQVEGVAERARQSTDLSPPGHTLPVTWSPVAGATGVEVTAASLTLTPAVVEQVLTDVQLRTQGVERIVTIPGGPRVASLALFGLKRAGGSELRNTSDLNAAGVRLVASVQGPGGWNPFFSVPAANARGLLPQSLTGATFDNSTFHFSPSLQASTLKLSLVTGRFPEEFAAVDMALGSVNATVQLPPRNVEVVGPDGAVVWQFPNELLPETPPVAVDFRVGLENAFKAAVTAKIPLSATFIVRADAPSRAFLKRATVNGAVLRSSPGVLRTTLAGDPLPLNLNGSLAGEMPSEVTGDLTIRYDGLRILDPVSDIAPTSSGGVRGIIVGNQPALREFLPGALEGVSVAKIGLVGRAPEACELSVQLVQLPKGTALGSPGVIKLAVTPALATIWLDVPHALPLTGPIGVTVRANQGRFFWVSTTQPLVRIAIHDPDPGNRPLLLVGQPLITIDQAAIHKPAFVFPTAAFRSTAPVLSSSLFLTVDMSDLVLRYRR